MIFWQKCPSNVTDYLRVERFPWVTCLCFRMVIVHLKLMDVLYNITSNRLLYLATFWQLSNASPSDCFCIRNLPVSVVIRSNFLTRLYKLLLGNTFMFLGHCSSETVLRNSMSLKIMSTSEMKCLVVCFFLRLAFYDLPLYRFFTPLPQKRHH